MSENWYAFRETLNITPEEEELINIEKSVIAAIINARE
jgi:hypothetical protein